MWGCLGLDYFGLGWVCWGIYVFALFFFFFRVAGWDSLGCDLFYPPLNFFSGPGGFFIPGQVLLILFFLVRVYSCLIYFFSFFLFDV